MAEAIGRVRISTDGIRTLLTITYLFLFFFQDNYVIVRSLTADLKAIKNETELEGFRQCHIRDGAALARYFAWLEEQLNKGAKISESQGADQLEKYRSYVSI
jgi:Xaa-Pro aminopeptidase